MGDGIKAVCKLSGRVRSLPGVGRRANARSVPVLNSMFISNYSPHRFSYWEFITYLLAMKNVLMYVPDSFVGCCKVKRSG